jgi:hypothetical protein
MLRGFPCGRGHPCLYSGSPPPSVRTRNRNASSFVPLATGGCLCSNATARVLPHSYTCSLKWIATHPHLRFLHWGFGVTDYCVPHPECLSGRVGVGSLISLWVGTPHPPSAQPANQAWYPGDSSSPQLPSTCFFNSANKFKASIGFNSSRSAVFNRSITARSRAVNITF